MESETSIIGQLQTGEETFAPGGLQLEPGIRALPEGQVCGAEAVVGVALPVGIGGQAESHVVADPELALAADGDGVQTVETWRVLITHHQTGSVAPQTRSAHQQGVPRRRKQTPPEAPPRPPGE